ncbi:DUF4440 domain-containing protein [Pseudomonas sp. 5P_3.1_Bac2]|uniref:nuclear transport factor 2 family protein n=1 Tax=Pseudomonas sp. 5P_3.1_Bac2 TaxID=2971617 RepID=UPI0021CA8F61|nr:DUF4440 domain-containing protein [Pseudomonas sp. 5P_3.1_Bac2]MCU1719518.1 DUF4440 domain-containing protein [Pseudomonas sp. 5P_3.1_Bac2]
MDPLTECLVALERELHKPAVRLDRQRVDQLLHAEFHEIGRSGLRYSRAQILAHMLAEGAFMPVYSQAFNLSQLAKGVCLLTYKSAVLSSAGDFLQHTHRSSIWRLEAQGWQLFFHQGTPAAQPFTFEVCSKT